MGTGELDAGGNPAIDKPSIQGGLEILLVAWVCLMCEPASHSASHASHSASHASHVSHASHGFNVKNYEITSILLS